MVVGAEAELAVLEAELAVLELELELEAEVVVGLALRRRFG